MEKQVDVAILGAGSAGLYAWAQVKRRTDNYVVIDGGEMGTTCARVGCMPSKALIQVAEDFHRRKILEREGIEGGDALKIHIPAALEHVQDLRDLFVEKVLGGANDNMGDKLITEYAHFLEPCLLQAGDQRIRARRVIIATGSSPAVPEAWRSFGDRIVTTDDFFELEDLPPAMAVIGLGVIGLELGQAIARLGVEVTGIEQLDHVAHLGDGDINRAAIETIGRDFALWLGHAASIEEAGNGRLRLTAGDRAVEVDRVLASMGRRPNLDGLNLGAAGIELDDSGVPRYDRHTMQIEDKPVFIAGDVTGERPLLHEAGDEGRIAGFNAVADTPVAFRRRVPLTIAFCDPNIVQVGTPLGQLDAATTLTARVKFGPIGRALIMGRNRGELELYADRRDGRLLGAAMVAPHGEHLGHLLALALHQGLTAHQLLHMPFYHPVLEEALQPALRELASGCVSPPAEPMDLQPL